MLEITIYAAMVMMFIVIMYVFGDHMYSAYVKWCDSFGEPMSVRIARLEVRYEHEHQKSNAIWESVSRLNRTYAGDNGRFAVLEAECGELRAQIMATNENIKTLARILERHVSKPSEDVHTVRAARRHPASHLVVIPSRDAEKDAVS